MTKQIHLEVCLGEITPRDAYCKICMEDDRAIMKKNFCYTSCTIPKSKMPLPQSEEEFEAEAWANYHLIISR